MNTDCRALELWGKNLQSTVGEKFTRVELAMIKLPPFQFSVIIGLILSDCWLGFASNRHKNVHLQFQQSKANSEYLWFVEGARARLRLLRRGGPDKSPAQNFNILCHYCKSFPTLRKSIGGGITYLRVRFDTRSLLCLTDIYSRRALRPYVSTTGGRNCFTLIKLK
jgi:hypothetical protein